MADLIPDSTHNSSLDSREQNVDQPSLLIQDPSTLQPIDHETKATQPVNPTETNMDPEIELENSSMDPEITVETSCVAQPSLTPEQQAALKLCQQCQLRDWKYTCPRCLFHSCSLPCVLSHKSLHNCSGIRDKSAYVAMRNYNESHMMSDYTYLEDVSRQSDNLSRLQHKEAKVKADENRSKAFVRTVNQLGIKFSSLPVGMSRHKLNQSNYSKNLKQVFWSVEVNFCLNDKRERYLEHSFPNNKPLGSFFENLLFSPTPQGKSDFAILRHQLAPFIDAGLPQFEIALKMEKAPRGHFVHLTDCQHLVFGDVLKGQVIIEYPIFFVWIKGQQQPKEVLELKEKKLMIMPLVDKEMQDVEEKAAEDVAEEAMASEIIIEDDDDDEEESILEEQETSN